MIDASAALSQFRTAAAAHCGTVPKARRTALICCTSMACRPVVSRISGMA